MAGSSFLALSDPTKFMTNYRTVADNVWARYEEVQLTIKDFEDMNPDLLGPDAEIEGKPFQWLQRKYGERDRLEARIQTHWAEYATAFAKTVEGWVKTGYLVPVQEIMGLLTLQVQKAMVLLPTSEAKQEYLAHFDVLRSAFYRNNPGTAERLTESGQKLLLSEPGMVSDHPMARQLEDFDDA